jgi:hypothetical protein
MSNQPSGYRANLNLKAPGINLNYTQEQLEDYIKCAKDPIYFIEKHVKIVTLNSGLAPFIPYDYQKRFIREIHDNRFVISKFPRQSGKSSCVLGYINHYINFQPDVRVAILANKQKTATDLFSRLQTAYENLPQYLQQGVLEWNKTSLKLENGSSVVCAATSASAIRGGSYNFLLLDEFAYLPQNIAEEFYASTYPTISSGTTSKIVIVSTPHGLNHYYNLWVNSKRPTGHPLKNKFVPVEISWKEVPLYPGGPLRDENWKQETIANTSEEQFNQEFECSFIGSSNTLISSSKLNVLAPNDPIEQTMEGLRIYEQPDESKTYFLLADVSRGQGNDFSAFVVVEGTQTPYNVVASFQNNTISPFAYPTVIKNVAERYNNAYVMVEVNDVGGQVCTILYNDLGYENMLMTQTRGVKGQVLSQGFAKGRSEMGIRTTAQTKKIGCAVLKRLVEEDKLLLNDDRIIRELMSFVSKANSFRAEDRQTDDLVMCLVFFSWLTRQEYFTDLIETAKNKYSQNDSISPEEDNVLFMMGDKDKNSEEIPPEGWSDGNFVWFSG